MNRFLLSTTLAVIGLFILDGQTASAQRDFTWTGNVSRVWSLGTNWVFNDTCIVPLAAVFPGSTMAVNDTALVARDIICAPPADRLAVIRQPQFDVAALTTPLASLTIREQMTLTFFEEGAVLEIAGVSGLEIAAGGVLDVSLATASVVLSGAGEHLIDGELILRTFLDGNASTLQIDTSLDIGGSGAIIGLHDTAKIKIADGETLKLRPDLKIEGALTIQGVADGGTEKFVNDGTVNAGERAPGQRILTFDVELTVEGHGEFRVGEFSATDQIDFAVGVTATRLNADFSILDGVLDINTPFFTAGHLYMLLGEIQCNPVGGGQCTFAGR